MSPSTTCFDALTSNRVYRKAFPLGKALEMMKEDRSRHFDPALLDAFTASLGESLAIMEQYHDQPSTPEIRTSSS